ncbi:unnamed protein product [Closterium sp. NIES-53]
MVSEPVQSRPVGPPHASAAVFPVARLGRVAIFVLSRARVARDIFSARHAPRGTVRGGPAPCPAFSATAGGEGVRVWGSRGSGTGVAGVRPTSSRPSTSPLFPPLLLLQQCGGEGEGEGEEMEGVTNQSQPASSLSLLPLLWSGGDERRPQSIDQPSPTSRCEAAQGEADIEEDVVDKGRRQLQRQEPRRREGVVLDGRHSGADGLAGARGWQGLPRGGGSCAGKPNGGAARQWLLPPPDGDEGGLRRHGAERRCEARAWIQRGATACRGSWNRRPATGGGKRVLIPDVLYVPGVQVNLLSTGQLKESGVQLQGDGNEMLLVAATGEVLGRARYNGRVLCTDLRPCSTQSSSTEVVALQTIVLATKSTPAWLHAHIGVDTIKSSAKHEVATGLNIKSSTGADSPCVSCVGGKLARHTFPDKGSDAEEALTIVHIDLCWAFRVAAKDGSLYFLLLKDHHTRFVWVMPVAKKNDVLREFQKWLVQVERQAKKLVLMLRSDRGGEFLVKEITDFVDGKGIVHDPTCPYTPQQNGMAEQEMRTAVESVSTMLLHMGVQHHWWHLALREAVRVRNCLERSTTPPGTTPYHVLTRKKPDLTLTWVWGCMVQFMVPEQQRGGKLAPKARWGLHLGVSSMSKGWEVIDQTNNKGVTTVEVIFYETLSLEVWKAKYGPPSGRTQANPPTDTSTATKGEAVKAAMEEEIRSLIGMGTWELVQCPRGVNIVKNRWVLTTKYCIDDTIEREKARLVVKGFTQVCGADYHETYSLVSSFVTLRIFLSIVTVLDLSLMQLDMKNAFLYSKLDRVLYMYQPDYFDDGTGRVCKLLKSLYGLLQSPLLWYKALDGVLLGNGWKKSQVDEALYFKAGDNGFAVTTTRPDIAFACSKLGSGLTVRSNQHWRKVDRCLTYLADTRDTALEFSGGPASPEMISYVDADDAGDKQNPTSTGGYVFVFGGAAVSWSSSRINCVTLSSKESEYVAAMDVGKEGRRLCFLLAEFKLLDTRKATILRVDNKSAITVSEGLGLTGNLKHMEQRYAWLQHMVRRGKFVLKYVSTTEKPAGFLTKALHFPAFNRCSIAIGQVRLANVGDGDHDVHQ